MLGKKLIKTLPLYIVSIKTLYHIFKDNIHAQFMHNLSSKYTDKNICNVKLANIYMKSIEFLIRMHNIIT